MADKTLVQRIKLDGGEDIRKELASIGKAGEDAFRKLQDAAGATQARGGFAAAISDGVASLKKSLGETGKAFADFGTAAKDALKAASLLGAGIAAAGVGIAALGRNVGNRTQDIQDTATALGLTNSEFQNFADIAKQTGLDQGALTAILARFDATMANAGDSAGAAAPKFLDLRDGIKSTTPEIERARKALAAIKPLTLAEQTKELEARISEVGIVMAQSTTPHALKLRDAYLDLAKAQADLVKENAKAVDAMNTKLATVEPTPDNAGPLAALSGTIEQRVTKFAAQLARLNDPLDRFRAVMAAGFDRRVAVQALNFFDAIAAGAGEVIPVLTDFEIAAGADMSKAIARTEISLGRLKDRLVLVFAAPLKNAADSLTKFLVDNEAQIVSFVTGIRDAIVPIMADVFNALTGNDKAVVDKRWIELRETIKQVGEVLHWVFDVVLLPALAVLRSAADGVAVVINSLFGSNISGDALLAVAAIGWITGAFGLLGAAITLATTLAGNLNLLLISIGAVVVLDLIRRISELTTEIQTASDAAVAANPDTAGKKFADLSAWEKAMQIVTEIKAGIEQQLADLVVRFGVAWDAIKQIFVAFVTWLKAWAGDFFAPFSALGEKLKAVFGGVATWVEDRWTELSTFVSRIADAIIAKAKAAAAALAKLNPFGSGSSTTPTGGEIGTVVPNAALAGGGPVRGPGTGTSDSILAWISDGEFVHTAAAVRKYGVGFMQALNSLRLPRDIGRRFALGGFAESLGRSLRVPRFASGGLAALGPAGPALTHRIDLTVGDQTFAGLMAPEETAGQIMRYAERRTIRRAGASPSWRGA